MDQGIVARIEDWEDRPFSRGYDGLQDLAAAEFSGAVTARGAWLFMLNGRIVGVVDGSVSDFSDADGTAYQAPHPSLPLLFVMQSRGGETEARYYTDDTPLTEVDATLTEGNFTGYIELSENVLSGDYYLVYYGGRSLSVAFVGNAEQLVTDEEARELAADEVGIYEVRSVDLEVQDVPEPSGDAGADPTSETPDSASTAEADETGLDDEPPTDAGGDEVPIEEVEADDHGEAPPDHGRDAPEGTAVDAETEDAAATGGEAAGGDRDRTDAGTTADPAEPGPSRPGSEGRAGTDEDPFTEEEAWRETRTIPSLDPDESEEAEGPGREGRSSGQQQRSRLESSQPAGDPETRIAELREAIEDREEKIEALEGELDEAAEERERLASERDRLERRVRELEARLEDAGETGGEGAHLDPTEAFSATDLFVRYDSKGRATLEEAHAGTEVKDDVNENLRLEEHTRFDGDTATVDGVGYREFLAESLEYRFVRWLVRDLLYEIQDTDNQKALRDLYDAIPAIDRVAFGDTITSRDEEGEEREERFDVVCRDRMGQPLIVADLNDARDPASGDMMEGLISRSGAVAEAHDSVAASFLVTASFFEPDALETAAESTDGGLLNRDSRKSFVKLSRKRGFHLCLVEAREDAFHVAVPEI